MQLYHFVLQPFNCIEWTIQPSMVQVTWSMLHVLYIVSCQHGKLCKFNNKIYILLKFEWESHHVSYILKIFHFWITYLVHETVFLLKIMIKINYLYSSCELTTKWYHLKASVAKWVNSIWNIIAVNSLRLRDLHIIS